jgi:glucose-6-phosphate dehydrogenase assembly protein OpcA
VTNLETFTAGEETAVAVANVERQLRELWQLAAESEKDPTMRHVSRACLFNLIAVCESETQRDRATQIIAALTGRHPCRAIVLLMETETGTSELRAAISAHCHLAGGGGKQVCCEQISIEAAGASVAHVPGAVLPLLESDLPTVLWWESNFLRQPELFDRLAGVSDRVLYDTSQWIEARKQLGELLAAIGRYRHCVFSDLSWTRLAQWREMTAEMFDRESCRNELGDVDALRVTHGPGPGAVLRATLFGAWLATRSGWSAAETAQRLEVRQCPESEPVSAGLLTVEICAGRSRFVLRKNHGESTASSSVSTPEWVSLPRKRAFWPTDDVSLLSQELDHTARHRVYEQALRMAAAIVSSSQS